MLWPADCSHKVNGAGSINFIECLKLRPATKEGKPMESTKVLLVGTVMWSCGGFLMFHGTDLLPVWVVWTVGPLCWYLGCAVALVGGVVTLGHFLKSVKERAVERERRDQAILRFKLMNQFAPASVTHEMPSTGDSLTECLMYGLSQGDRL